MAHWAKDQGPAGRPDFALGLEAPVIAIADPDSGSAAVLEEAEAAGAGGIGCMPPA